MSDVAGPVIELEAVDLVRGGHAILKDVTWTVKRDEHWAIIGPNGCGKTTLMNIVSGWLFPSRGTAAVLGARFGHCDMMALRRRVGWVSHALEQVIRPRLTALGVVLTGMDATLGIRRDPETEEIATAQDSLERVGCPGCAELPFAYLSQGEKMRVMIARALLADPRLLVLDEACVGLDPVAREAFLEMIEEFARRASAPTILYVTHHIDEIVPAVSRVLALREGRVSASGTKAEVLTSSVLERVFGCPFEVVFEAGRYRAHPDAGFPTTLG